MSKGEILQGTEPRQGGDFRAVCHGKQGAVNLHDNFQAQRF